MKTHTYDPRCLCSTCTGNEIALKEVIRCERKENLYGRYLAIEPCIVLGCSQEYGHTGKHDNEGSL